MIGVKKIFIIQKYRSVVRFRYTMITFKDVLSNVRYF